MDIKNLGNGEILYNIKIIQPNKIYSSEANESEVENVFDEYLKNLGYKIGKSFTKRSSKKHTDTFPSKTGTGLGYPDYIFYANGESEEIIAIGEIKNPDPRGVDRSILGLNECVDIYLKDYNRKHKNKIKIAFGYDGFNFVIKYFNGATNIWEDIIIDSTHITSMPEPMLLLSIHNNGNEFSTQTQKNISKEELEPYFTRCDSVFRNSKSSLSAIDKATEVSVFIFLKIFSKDNLDAKFRKESNISVWDALREGKVNLVNSLFKAYLNEEYEDVFPEKLINIDSKSSRELASIIDIMFKECNIDRMTDVKGNALEYFQKFSKDRKIGEFFTPRHIIEMMVHMVNPIIEFEKYEDGNYIEDEYGNRKIKYIEKIYDPACGSGGFLIHSFVYYLDKYGKFGVIHEDLRNNVIFGNELKDRTSMLTKLNMILLGDGHNTISNENALFYKKIHKVEKIKDSNGKFVEIDEKDIIYKDVVVGTSIETKPFCKSDGHPAIEEVDNKINETSYFKGMLRYKKDGITPEYEYRDIKPVNPKVKKYHDKYFGKFDIVLANQPYGLEEPQKPDELFIKHMLESVKKGGRISCIVGETLLFHKTYSSFRKWAINNITVEAIISLPQGVFNPYTDVKTSILFLKNEKPPIGHKTWFVEMQHDGFDLKLSRSPIKNNDIPEIIQLWEKWGGYEIEGLHNTEYKSFHKEKKGFAEFHHIQPENWCVKRYNTPLISINSKYKLHTISDVLKRNKTVVNIEDINKYKQVTIQLWNKGVILRNELYGREIGTKKQFEISDGQFIISKIDARNGAYGIVPKELNGAIITGNFWAYDINRELILPEYLIYLMRHDFFLQMCNMCSYGTTNRWYLDEDTFNNFKIPVPSIEEQRTIISNIEKHISNIKRAEDEIEKEKSQIKEIIANIVTQ